MSKISYFALKRETTTEDDTTLKVTAELSYLRGNPAPYFSVTADEYDPTLLDDEDGGLVSVRCQHELVLEHWPDLRPLVELHLSDCHGVPMHHVENGWYWAGGTKWGLDGGAKTPRQILASHLRITEEQAAKLERFTDKWAHTEWSVHAKCLFAWWVGQQRSRWLDEAKAGMRLLGASEQDIEKFLRTRPWEMR
jgi:hypothetical protein